MSNLVGMLKSEYLRPQDVVVACKLYSYAEGARTWTYANLAEDVGLSIGEVHNAIVRCKSSQVVGVSGDVVRPVFRDLLVVAVPRVYFAVRGSVADGLLTSVSSPVLAGRGLSQPSFPVVWPSPAAVGDPESGAPPSGWSRGESLAPVHASAVTASLVDSFVYEIFSLVDVVRVGTRRDVDIAVSSLEKIVLKRRSR